MIVLNRPEALLLVPIGTAVILWLGRGATGWLGRGATGWLGRSATGRLGRGARPGVRRWTSLAARLLILLLVAGALAEPIRIASEPLPRRLVALLDVSDSTSNAERGRAVAALSALLEADPVEDRRAIAFAGRTARIPWPDRNGDLVGTDLEPGETDVAGALAAAVAEAESGVFLRVVLATDGRATRGDARAAAGALRRAGAVVDVLPLAGPAPAGEDGGPRVLALDAPGEGDAGAPIAVRALVADAGEVILRAGGAEVARTRTAGDGETVATFPDIMLPEGVHRLTAALAGAPGAGRSRAIRIRPGPRVRVVRAREKAGLIESALATAGLEAEVIGPGALRAVLADAGPADVILLETDGVLEALVAALPETVGALRRGASLIFGAGAGLDRAGETPLAAYLPVIPSPPKPEPEIPPPSPEATAGDGVRLDTVEKDAVRVALVLAVDTSGSMRGDKIAMARLAAYRAAETLAPQDTIGVLGFSEDPYWIVRPIAASNRNAIRHALAGVVANGGTNVYEALRESFRVIRGVRAGVRHVILLSDGHTPGSMFRTLVTRAAGDRITLTTVGIGRDIDTSLLNDLARWGQGAFRFAATPRDIPTIVTGDTERILAAGRGEPLAPGGAPPEVAEPERPEKAPTPGETPSEPPSESRAAPLRVASPHPALAGIEADAVPPLGGLTPCRARAATWVALETEADGQPVLAEWRVGLGRVLVLSADLEAPAAADWRTWPDLTKLWIQAARALASASGPGTGPSIRVRWTPDEVIVRAEAGAGEGTPSLSDPEAGDGGLAGVEIGPGVVETRLPRGADARTVLVEARVEGSAPRGRIVEVPPAVRRETATPGTDRHGLEALVRAAGGRLDPPPTAVPHSPERPRREPIGFWLLVLAGLLLPLDVAVRRLGRAFS